MPEEEKKIRLIAFDLDGTLLNEQKEVTQETKNAIAHVVSLGIEVVPATGRPFGGSFPEFGIPGIRYMITSNGAGIYERSGSCIHEETMPLQAFLPLLAKMEKLDVMADAFVRGKAYMNEDKKKWIDHMCAPEPVREYVRRSRTTVPSQSRYLEKKGVGVEKLTINFACDDSGHRIDYDKAWEIAREYKEFHAVSGGMNNIEITKKGVTKASGLRWLGNKLGISMKEMMVFGDSGNDLAMIREAGLGVAMANAENEVLEVADYITKSNEEDGIAYAINHFRRQLACRSECRS